MGFHMLVLQQKQVKSFLLALICLCGLSAGYFTAQLTGYLLHPPAPTAETAFSQPDAQSTRSKDINTDLIVKKNIFHRYDDAVNPAK